MRNPRKEWTEVEEHLKAYCALHGYIYEERQIDRPVYQLAKIIGPNFCIIAYPHQTRSTGNKHIRLRDQGSKDKQAYEAAVLDFYNSKDTLGCTLQTKHFDHNKAWQRKKETCA